MVVLAPGRTVRPEDIPTEVRGGRGALLPVPVRPAALPTDERSPAELEFILRTLFDLKMDVDDLRREFEAYRQRRREEPELPSFPIFPTLPGGGLLGTRAAPEPEPVHEAVEEDAVVYRPGMTMQDLEREAIAIALRDVKGNRRKAARTLGIGERTLYRKIKEYGLEE
jgi:DNA-binding NtrC family response regulator